MTDNWFWKSLGDGMTAYAPSAEIEAAFQPLFAAAGSPAVQAAIQDRRLDGIS